MTNDEGGYHVGENWKGTAEPKKGNVTQEET
jgi:hypothetical protein